MADAVLITRPEPAARAVQTALALRGIAALRAPLLTLQAVSTPRPDCAEVSGVIFTSAAAVAFLPTALLPEGWASWPCYCVGKATAQAASEAGWQKAVSADGDGAALAALFLAQETVPRTWLHPCGVVRRAEPAATLGAQGHAVLDWEVYDAVAATAMPDAALRAIRAQQCSTVLFYSPRSAEIFVRLSHAAGLAEVAESMTAWCLSPQVAKAAAALPWRAVLTAPSPDAAALLSGLQNWLRQGKMPPNPA